MTTEKVFEERISVPLILISEKNLMKNVHNKYNQLVYGKEKLIIFS